MVRLDKMTNEIYDKLKEYVTSNSQYSPKFKKNAIALEYPCVVVSARTIKVSQSSDYFHREKIRQLIFDIDIYTIDKNNIPSDEIASELETLVATVMEECYNMNGGTSAKLYKVNTANATQYSMNYDCQWFVNKNRIL